MLTRLEKAQQKWGGSHTIIDKWLTERQELLVLYCKIAGFSPYDKKDHALPDQLQIQTFCQILMDYLSAGHFEVYDDDKKAPAPAATEEATETETTETETEA